ncbi:MAG TPA: hypothetical protein VGF84_19035 [Micromonosporaceae bacterium]|jgi:hypothetical protein
MTGIVNRTALLAAAGCLFLTACGPAKATTAAPPAPAGVATATTAPTATAAAAAGVGGQTACDVITAQDASTALGKSVGPGTPGGTAALSECIYDGGSLIVGVKTNAKAEYDKSYTAATGRGATRLTGVGDSAFVAGTTQNCSLLLLKGTTLVSVLFGGPDAQRTAVAVAKIAASKL